MSTGSHFEFQFLHKPIVYGVARLLYGVATSDSVTFVYISPESTVLMTKSTLLLLVASQSLLWADLGFASIRSMCLSCAEQNSDILV